MIIEAFGMPGSGKTTYINSLKSNGVIKAGSANTGIWRVVKECIKYTPYAFYYRYRLSAILSFSDDYSYFIGRRSREYLKRIVILASIYHYSKKDLYIDEGLIHRIITYVVAFDLDENLVFEVINKLVRGIKDISFTYIRTTPDKCIESIIRRNRHDCPFDELSKDVLFEYLKRYFLIAEKVQSELKCKVIEIE